MKDGIAITVTTGQDNSRFYRYTYQETYEVRSYYNISENAQKRTFLPELRGDLFKGTVSANDEKLTVENRDLAISDPGDNFFLKISHTNQQGDFYFSLDKAQSIDHLYIQVLGENEQKFDIKLDSISNFDYSPLEFPELTITRSMEREVVSRSMILFRYRPPKTIMK